MFAFLSAPVDTPPFLGSLTNNSLCGIKPCGEGTYTAEGITKLCEALKGSAVTSLKCAATLHACLSVNAIDKKANTYQPIMHLTDISCPCDTQRWMERHHG